MEPSIDLCGTSSSSIIEDNTSTRNMIRWKSGKRVDPRLMTVLQLFGEIYMERHEFFNKIFRGNHEDAFKKIENLLKRKKTMKKAKSMPRSLSMRAIGRQRGLDGEINDDLLLERFKIRTPDVIVADPVEQGEKTTT
ncbi:tRNA/tmRNA (uracil-C(5))-methyltransferase [Striga asiatica]|uniref:tRNA/tmRNA (Uracil-C(5))-methyltransferase n=1 Tax=Striga asiatica TaxID=4170 RepID=A0A5A7P7Y5_STRAF|nr:tRNA/tmRNA (uracil-C(5))-methyltransferase [Striga asiatica]